MHYCSIIDVLWACPYASLRVATLRGSPSATCFAPLRALQAAHAENFVPEAKHHKNCPCTDVACNHIWVETNRATHIKPVGHAYDISLFTGQNIVQMLHATSLPVDGGHPQGEPLRHLILFPRTVRRRCMQRLRTVAFLRVLAIGCKFLREPPGGPRSGGEAMSEAKPVRRRPRRGHAQIIINNFCFLYNVIFLQKTNYALLNNLYFR